MSIVRTKRSTSKVRRLARGIPATAGIEDVQVRGVLDALSQNVHALISALDALKPGAALDVLKNVKITGEDPIDVTQNGPGDFTIGADIDASDDGGGKEYTGDMSVAIDTAEVITLVNDKADDDLAGAADSSMVYAVDEAGDRNWLTLTIENRYYNVTNSTHSSTQSAPDAYYQYVPEAELIVADSKLTIVISYYQECIGN